MSNHVDIRIGDWVSYLRPGRYKPSVKVVAEIRDLRGDDVWTTEGFVCLRDIIEVRSQAEPLTHQVEQRSAGVPVWIRKSWADKYLQELDDMKKIRFPWQPAPIGTFNVFLKGRLIGAATYRNIYVCKPFKHTARIGLEIDDIDTTLIRWKCEDGYQRASLK